MLKGHVWANQSLVPAARAGLRYYRPALGILGSTAVIAQLPCDSHACRQRSTQGRACSGLAELHAEVVCKEHIATRLQDITGACRSVHSVAMPNMPQMMQALGVQHSRDFSSPKTGALTAGCSRSVCCHGVITHRQSSGVSRQNALIGVQSAAC